MGSEVFYAWALNLLGFVTNAVIIVCSKENTLGTVPTVS